MLIVINKQQCKLESKKKQISEWTVSLNEFMKM